jgi:Protein of unknown function (DUF4038)/Domain of unknown function (DUF5060)
MEKRDKLDRRQFLQGSLLIPAAAVMQARRGSAAAGTGSEGNATSGKARVWEKQELTFTAAGYYQNAYTTVTMWVDLTGPNFSKRLYGFWDGGQTFRVRLVATAPGEWKWSSGSTPEDPGLSGKTGSFVAVDWTEAEKQQNPLRRGFLRASANRHALETADGTPFFVLGDTWWAAGTGCLRWYDDDVERPIGPEAGFKDYVRFRKAQGYNWISMIAAFPNWETDGLGWEVFMKDGTVVRSAWLEFGTGSAKNMSNEGGQPFLFPGKVPGFEKVFADVDRINPDYFKCIDRKIDYLNAQGFIAFMEVSRRDSSECWKKYYSWPDSYTRFIQYIWSRYQANSTVLSPIHLDSPWGSVTLGDYMQAIHLVLDRYGPPPFGTLLSADANPSTLVNWGENSWVTLHQTGNRREHEYYWYLTQIYREAHPPRPALDGEPYYSGYKDARAFKGGYKYGAPGGTPTDDRYVRSAMYGTVLSGGLAGYVYGAEGIDTADIQPSAPTKMWDAFKWNSATQGRHLRTFVFSIGKRYRDLEPNSELVAPSKTHVLKGYDGWAYAARTPEKEIFLAYFEQGCPRSLIRGARLWSAYQARWFDPRNGTWSNAGDGTVKSDIVGEIQLPDFPSNTDWGLSLVYRSALPMPQTF